MKKSDDMLKSLAAQVASQGVGIYQQMSAEHQEQVDHFKQAIRELTSDNVSLSRRLDERTEELKKILADNRSLKENLEASEKSRDEMRTWWLEASRRSGDLMEELEKLKDEQDEAEEALA
jgi:chromosome segregation ATPase